MVSIPRRMACFGLRMSTRLPLIHISPASWRWTPERILISVDLPAPLSPTRPTDSPSATSRFTFLSAWTPEYHLCRPWHRMIGCFIVHLYLYLDGACGPAQPCIADNGDHREQADGELEPIGIDVAEHHA